MKFKWLILGLLAVAVSANAASVHQGKYGVAGTFNFSIYNTDGTLDDDASDGGTDVSLICDNGTPATATNDFADEGSGTYSIALTAAEMQCDKLSVEVASTTTERFDITTLAPGLKTHGIAQTGSTSTTIVLAAATSFADDFLIGATVEITGGTGAGQSRQLTDWTSTGDVGTIGVAWITTPDTTSTYDVWSTAPGSSGGGATAQEVWEYATRVLTANTNFNDPTAAAIVNEWESQSQADPTGFHVNVLEVGGTAQTANDNGADINAILVDTGTAGVALAANSINASVIANGAIDAATFAADVDAEILSYIVDDATQIDASALNTAIAALTFTVSGQVDANVQSVNDVALTGDGSGTPFNVASFRDFKRACRFYGGECAEVTRAAFMDMRERSSQISRQVTLLEVVAEI